MCRHIGRHIHRRIGRHIGAGGPFRTAPGRRGGSIPQPPPRPEAPLESPPARRALLIGVDAYPGLSPTSQLRGCVNDARAVRDLLVDGLGVDPTAITLLTSPASLPGERPADAASVRGAFAALLADPSLDAGSHLVLFLAGHGVVLRREIPGAKREIYYGFAPSDTTSAVGGLVNLVLDRELNHLLRGLQRRGVSVTVLADTCHSGSSTRAVESGARERSLAVAPLSDEAFTAFIDGHPALATGSERGLSPSVSRFGVDDDADFVVLAACQDHQTAKEDTTEEVGEDGARRVVQHGLFTRALLDVLRRTPDSRVATLRWLDIQDALVHAMAARVAERRAAGDAVSDQVAALEGRRERLVFGGAFRPSAPGFTARVDGGVLRLDGGVLHGLEPGALVAVYPPDTRAFDGPPPLTAVVRSATGATCVVTVEGCGVPAADRSRCRLLAHAPTRGALLVRWVDVPDAVREAAMEAAGELVREAPPMQGGAPAPAHVEVRRFAGALPAGLREGDAGGDPVAWAVVRLEVDGVPGSATAGAAAPDDVVAYVPAVGGPANERDPRLGAAIGAGLAHYARYVRARERSSADPAGRALMSVRLLGARLPPEIGDGDLLTDADRARFEPLPTRDGRYEIDADLALFVEVTIADRSGLRLSIGLVAFSDDGNVLPLWPAEGQEPSLSAGQTVWIGMDRFRPLWLNARPDQARSRWTLKVLAATSADRSGSVNVAAFAVDDTVQDVILAALSASRGAIGRPAAPVATPAFATWELRVVVGR